MTHTTVGARNPYMGTGFSNSGNLHARSVQNTRNLQARSVQNTRNLHARSGFPDPGRMTGYSTRAPQFNTRADDVGQRVLTPPQGDPQPTYARRSYPTPYLPHRSDGQARRVARTPPNGFCYFIYRLFRCLFCCH